MTSTRETYQLMGQLKNNNSSTQPALAIGATTSTVAGVLSLVLYFFPEIPSSTIQAILVISAFLLPIISAIATRGFVWSPASVQVVVDEAVKRALEATKKPDKEDPPFISGITG